MIHGEAEIAGLYFWPCVWLIPFHSLLMIFLSSNIVFLSQILKLIVPYQFQFFATTNQLLVYQSLWWLKYNATTVVLHLPLMRQLWSLARLNICCILIFMYIRLRLTILHI